jgi:hypothetical protein
MKNSVGSHLEKKKKAYEPPEFSRVRLEVKTSVLSVCSLSVPVAPNIGTCQDPFGGCEFAS